MKQWIKNNIVILRTALIWGVVITLILQITVLSHQCYGIRHEVLRLHILANSDSEADQSVKIAVRDALLKSSAPLLQGANSRQELLAIAEQSMTQLQTVAQQTVKAAGYDYPVTCHLADTYFETRTYDKVTLPAGTYTAVQVVLGEGKGKNWWCVMFPSLCLPAATQPVEKVLTPGQTELVEGGSRYKVKFKVVEWFQSVWHSCRSWF
ncbi:MAG: stage II sporulation protein R [Clostridia bacterium]|nr:stage II sporulation protein R [Clostridia bacterium]